MKKTIQLLLFIIIAAVLPIHCIKTIDNTPTPTPTPAPPGTVLHKPIRIKIMEYGSTTALQGVEVKSYKCEESGKVTCNRLRFLNTWISDSNGMIEIGNSQQSDTIFSLSMVKPDYFPINDPISFGNSIQALADTIISLEKYDSAVVRLFPNAWIKLQIKNSNSYKNKETIRTMIDAIRSASRSTNLEAFLPWNQPANNLDTVILYKTYGNIDNRITFELDDSLSNFIKIAYQGTKFIPKKDTVNWVINY